MAAGEKSSMLSKLRSMLSLPSPVSVLSTWKATRGLMDFMRASKLSMSISRNLRSAISGSGSTGLPDRSASTPITKGRSEEHTSELQSHSDLVCRLLLEKKKKITDITQHHIIYALIQTHHEYAV